MIMKSKVVLSLAFALAFATQVSAQVKLGVKGGLNVTSMSLSSSVLDASNRTGFFVGPMVKVTVPIVGLSLDAAALYDQREAKVSVQGMDEGCNQVNMKQKSLIVPVNVRYGIGVSSLANVFLFAGPQWGYNIGDKDFKWGEDLKYSLKRNNFSVNVGAGITLLTHLQLTANYNIVCGKSAEIVSSDETGTLARSRNNSWQIALGYWF